MITRNLVKFFIIIKKLVIYFRLVWKTYTEETERTPTLFEFKDRRMHGSYVQGQKDSVFVSLSYMKRKVTQTITAILDVLFT